MNLSIENITPILSVKDMDASRKFYVGILGFTEADWGTDEFTFFNRDQCGIYLCRNGQGNPGTWIWIGFDGDIYALYHELRSRDVKIIMSPTNHSWALEMQVEDPDGHILRFGTDPDESKPFFDQR